MVQTVEASDETVEMQKLTLAFLDVFEIRILVQFTLSELRHEKTCILHMQKGRCISALW